MADILTAYTGDVAHKTEGNRSTPHDECIASGDHRLHKPGVAGSSPAAATSSVSVLHDEPLSVYHADREYLGSSQLKVLDRSALDFERRVVRGLGQPESSEALTLGTLWHTLRELGIDQFSDRAVLVPPQFSTAGGALSTKKEAKEWAQQQTPDAILLTQDQSDTLEQMQAAFVANSAAVELEEAALYREPSLRWESTAGVKVRCRPDLICEGGRLVDFKSTREVSPLRSFCWAVKNFSYGLSAALYEQGCLMAGLATPPMYFAVSSTESYETQVLTLPQSYMDFCRKRLEELLLEVAERRISGNWNPVGYGAVHEISMPGFGDRNGGHIE